VTGVSLFEDLRALLETKGIHSLESALRNKELAKLGDPLTNLIFFLAAALRLAELRHLAPSRLDAHGLGDCVEAMIAYGWLRGFLTIPEATQTLHEQFVRTGVGTTQSKAERNEAVAMGFAVLLQQIWEHEQAENSV